MEDCLLLCKLVTTILIILYYFYILRLYMRMCVL